YAGIICERYGKALFRRGAPGAGGAAFEWLSKAMRAYEQAEALRPQDNEDALLRWNACARLLMQHPQLQPADGSVSPVELE
ncbi:MAG TPA: hypothetical protein VML55_21760, partial [Planctomycetaceae bacterium]|nr:hypothetical protein [Planctomycetaceae bacterium]